MRRGAVRELLKLTARPEMISFAGGLPAPELFPVAEVREATAAALARHGSTALQYGETEGCAGLRDWVAQQYSRPGRPVRRENVMITSGSQQALDLIGRVLLDEGDSVLVENPTYLALLSAWRPCGARFLGLGADRDGMRVEEIGALAKDAPKVVYTVPNFQNPCGTTLSLARRRQLIALVQQHDLLVVEDDPYGQLRYDGGALPSLLELDQEDARTGEFGGRVIHTSTFSKALAPGLRVGWIVAATEVIDCLVRAKQAVDLHTATLNQLTILELAYQGVLDAQIPRLRAAYAGRRDVMLRAMEKWFPPGVTWTRPAGGMFLLVTLPQGWDAGEVLRISLERGVAFVPGEEFHLDGRGKNTLRLNFSNASPERIETGIQRLGEVLKAMAHSHINTAGGDARIASLVSQN